MFRCFSSILNARILVSLFPELSMLECQERVEVLQFDDSDLAT